MGTTAIGLVRVSRVGGRTGAEFASPDIQRDRIKEVCQRNGWRLATVHEELDVSGGAPLEKRPGMRPAVDAVESGKAQIIVAAYGDRLFRDVDTERATIRRIERAGGRVYACDREFISTMDAASLLNMTLVGAVNENQRLVSKEKTAAGIGRAVERGAVAMPTPFGYRRDELKRLEPDPDTAPLVVRAFEMRAAGESIVRIQRTILDAGHRVAERTISDWFRSETYIGKVRNRGTVAEVEPLVSPRLWRAANGRRGTAREGARVSDALLARLRVVRCASCGRPMQPRVAKGVWGRYECPGGNGCDHPASISSRVVEGKVLEQVRRALGELEGRTGGADDAQEARRAADATQRALDDAVAAFTSAGLLTEPSAVAELANLRDARDQATARADEMEDRAAVRLPVADEWDQLAVEDQRRLIQTLVEEVEVTAAGRRGGRADSSRVRVWFRWGGYVLGHVPIDGEAAQVAADDAARRLLEP